MNTNVEEHEEKDKNFVELIHDNVPENTNASYMKVIRQRNWMPK